MALKTGAQYLEEMRAMRPNVYKYGKLIEDPVTDPITAAHLKQVAMWYDRSNDPAYEDIFTTTSYLSGQKAHRWNTIMTKMEDGVVDRYVGHSDNSRYQVLIAHNPLYFPQYAAWGADLTVSGHVHGGIIRLPLLGGVISPAIVLFPKYDGGKFEIDGKNMILSRGLGTHSIHVRMFNPCELCIIHVRGV